MPNRIQLDVRGSVYTFPVNPITFVSNDGQEYKLEESVVGNTISFIPFWDTRPRRMIWEKLPNNSTYRGLVETLQTALVISGVKINLRDIGGITGQDVWKDVRIDDVDYSFEPGRGPQSSENYVRINLSVEFTFLGPA